MKKKDTDVMNVQSRPGKEKDSDVLAIIGGMYRGARRAEYYRKELGLANKRAGINTSLVAEARTSMSEAECKGQTR